MSWLSRIRILRSCSWIIKFNFVIWWCECARLVNEFGLVVQFTEDCRLSLEVLLGLRVWEATVCLVHVVVGDGCYGEHFQLAIWRQNLDDLVLMLILSCYRLIRIDSSCLRYLQFGKSITWISFYTIEKSRWYITYALFPSGVILQNLMCILI